MADVVLKGISKSFGATRVVQAFDLSIGNGEFLVLLGPSGCGKSTTLRMIAGLESITSGDLVIGGKRMNDVEPKNRGVAMVFQNYALYPHKTVFDNMAMALKLQKVPAAEIRKRVTETAETLGLTPYLERKPAALSGGQRQRVAIGRAIVRTPEVFLFDEPLSNLDAKLRVRMRLELQELHRRLGVTSVYVTHDQIEAMTLADRVVVMDSGRVAQVGTPREVYDGPANLFVAGFIGSPAMNFIPMHRNASGGWTSDEGSLTLDALPFAVADRQKLTLGIRPEHVVIQPASSGQGLDATVRLAELQGADALLDLSIGGVSVLTRVGGADHPQAGQALKAVIPAERMHAFDPASGLAIPRA
ncbi:MAG: sn-glycerol-3-phosphate ABC transporter ATP-binding protein UgpC [Rhizobiaceae bacterium]